MDAETIAGGIFVLMVLWNISDIFSFSSHQKDREEGTSVGRNND